eukprot:GHVU01026367.1.p1 GENE.GHVU01026367.1~~GHVU01026367.1.p1  ORF type:complete len:143 (-),score=2.00 GHVU01026367.1:509-937(-)
MKCTQLLSGSTYIRLYKCNIRIDVRVCLRVRERVYVCACVCVCACACMCMCMCVYVCVCVYVYMCTCAGAQMYVCVYVYEQGFALTIRWRQQRSGPCITDDTVNRSMRASDGLALIAELHNAFGYECASTGVNDRVTECAME